MTTGEGVSTAPGSHEPRGATWSSESTNFAVFAPLADLVELCFFDDRDGSDHGEGPDQDPDQDRDRDPQQGERRVELTQTMGVWHGAVPEVVPGTRYGYRAHGPWDPGTGCLFNPAKLLLDPYALAISGELTYHDAVYAESPVDSAPFVPRSVVVDTAFDWGDDAPPRREWQESVIYELHVRGFTKLHDRIPAELRGTYAGLAHPVVIDYLSELGVTAVELLPVQHFLSEPAVAAREMTNYWGYNSIGFFAPHAAYAADDRGRQVTEFKEMVRAFHAAGIEVLLDVVYNHTAEGALDGPSLCWRGLDERRFYLRDGDDHYRDLTGCGNTVDSTYPQAVRLMLDSLRYWVTQMHVDGFRFDLASALARTDGRPDMRSAFLTALRQDPVLRDVKLVAEPWDATPEGYQVGRFPAPFCEWNDQYRDAVRDFWRGQGQVRDLASRLAGSSDLYADDGRSPYAPVNFVTAHDGFTLRDLVSYETKHNEANGEGNRDGTDNHRAWNCGVEGPSDDPLVNDLRRRQAMNLMATLCLSTGIPLLSAGDERGRTQRGNNNAFSQDNEVSWVDWRAEDAWLEVYDVARRALALRRGHPGLTQRQLFASGPAGQVLSARRWIHPEGGDMTVDQWHDEQLRTLGMLVGGDPSFLLWLHSGAAPVDVRLPQGAPTPVEVILSTDPAHPTGGKVRTGQITLGPRTVVALRTT